MEQEASGLNHLKENIGKLFKRQKPFRVEGLKTYAPFNPDYPFYPDLGPVPEVSPETEFQKTESVDIENAPDKFIFGVTGKGHLGGVYTFQVHDTPEDGRYLRIWRCPIGMLSGREERKRLQGQGLFVSLKDFSDDFFIFQPEHRGMIIKEGDRGAFPYFYEGEGPGGKIRVTDINKDETTWCTKIGSIYVPASSAL